MASKKVYFYKAVLTDLDGKEVPINKYREIFTDIIDRKSVNNGTYKSLDLTWDDDEMHIIWDIFDYNNSRLFGRLSKQKPSSSVIQRDYHTYEKKDILPVGDQQNRGIEQYTFGSLDYQTGIFSIISAKGAPSEKVICNIFLLYNLNYMMQLLPIPNVKGIETIYLGKDAEITRLEVEVPLPDAGVLANLFGWDMDEVVEAIVNRHLTAGVVLKPLSRQSITADTEESKRIIDKIKGRLNLYQKAKMKAKTKDVKLRDYNFYEENFSYPVDIQVYHIENYKRIYYTVDELVGIYRQHIVQAFQENKDVLVEIANRKSV